MRVTHSFLLSLAIHLSVVYALLWGYTQRDALTLSAGRSGESMSGLQVALLSSSAMQWQAINTHTDSAPEAFAPLAVSDSAMPDSSETAALPAEAILPVNAQAVVTLPESKPVPRRQVKEASERKREEPTVRKSAPPVKKRQEEPKTAEELSAVASPSFEREKAPREAKMQSDTKAQSDVKAQSIDGASTENAKETAHASSARHAGAQQVGAASRQGESREGQADQGAGNDQSQVVKALQRRVNYPTRARAMGVEGRVRLQFDITDSGTVTAIRVLSEDPAGMFSHDVIKDMARWRYQSGTGATNQTVSVIFQLNGHIELQR
ncbi:TonB family protein [Dickeya lacustris]|uniref:Protein TonB n=1 Tax=Dickeya lacustris TaxID=2259638 RepID=A0ABY8GAR3_9GAMM|nr:TonB family protein [Dickeya lacustris]WFN57076.1 TonB family protein [Dickeya lacustris]